MDEQTALHEAGPIGLPKIGLRTLEGCDRSALFFALRRILSDTKPAVTVSGFTSSVSSDAGAHAEPPDDLP
jgi:hypothetical protein